MSLDKVGVCDGSTHDQCHLSIPSMGACGFSFHFCYFEMLRLLRDSDNR